MNITVILSSRVICISCALDIKPLISHEIIYKDYGASAIPFVLGLCSLGASQMKNIFLMTHTM